MRNKNKHPNTPKKPRDPKVDDFLIWFYWERVAIKHGFKDAEEAKMKFFQMKLAEQGVTMVAGDQEAQVAQ